MASSAAMNRLLDARAVPPELPFSDGDVRCIADLPDANSPREILQVGRCKTGRYWLRTQVAPGILRQLSATRAQLHATAMTTPNSYAGWLQYNEATVKALVARIDELIRTKQILQKNMASAMKVRTEWITRARADIKKDWTAFKPKQFRLAVNFLQRKNLLMDGSETHVGSTDVQFLGLMRLAKMSPEEYDFALLNFEHTYAVYRYSHHLQGQYVLRGRISIKCDKESRAIMTHEEYSIQTMPENSTTEVAFNRTGRMVYRDKAPLIFSCKDNSRDAQTIHIQQAHQSSIKNHNKINWMTGVVFDWEDTQMYATRICIIDEAENVENPGFVCAIEPKRVPPRVKFELEKPMTSEFPFIARY